MISSISFDIANSRSQKQIAPSKLHVHTININVICKLLSLNIQV